MIKPEGNFYSFSSEEKPGNRSINFFNSFGQLQGNSWTLSVDFGESDSSLFLPGIFPPVHAFQILRRKMHNVQKGMRKDRFFGFGLSADVAVRLWLDEWLLPYHFGDVVEATTKAPAFVKAGMEAIKVIKLNSFQIEDVPARLWIFDERDIGIKRCVPLGINLDRL